MIEVSAQELCKTRDCATPGCEWDADTGSDLCFECGHGNGQTRLRSILGTTEPMPLRVERARGTAHGGRPASTELTPRERDVLECAGRGMSINETAEHLGKSRDTVSAQRRTARQRLDAMSLAHAVAIAYRRGLIA